MLIDGTIFNGSYENDKKHGKGELIYPSGQKINANWENDSINGPGTITEFDGKIV